MRNTSLMMWVVLMVGCATNPDDKENNMLNAILSGVEDFYAAKANAMNPGSTPQQPKMTKDQFERFLYQVQENPYVPEHMKREAVFAVERGDYDQYNNIINHYRPLGPQKPLDPTQLQQELEYLHSIQPTFQRQSIGTMIANK